ncbi:OsmC family protein [Xanthomonas massiliensis]|uniref:OsmC family protein n=1 Tax=Xanthomonas massiliensis TaxID=1720302 RepID=UPI0008265885|nr:OsmC family protein [Xanthomonas massiliensis]
MAADLHRYRACIRWTGDRGQGTRDYRAYGREHTVAVEGKAEIAGSADPAFLGDPARHNPEDLLLASLSSCHMLWYLHLAAEAGLVVTGYVDRAEASLDAAGQRRHFTEAVLRPQVTIAGGDPLLAEVLHEAAHQACFIAHSVNFPVRCEPVIVAAASSSSP